MTHDSEKGHGGKFLAELATEKHHAGNWILWLFCPCWAVHHSGDRWKVTKDDKLKRSSEQCWFTCFFAFFGCIFGHAYGAFRLNKVHKGTTDWQRVAKRDPDRATINPFTRVHSKT